MGSLRALDLTNNKLEGQLDPITTFFPRLQHLRVGNNQLTAIPDSICQLKDLQVRFQASDDCDFRFAARSASPRCARRFPSNDDSFVRPHLSLGNVTWGHSAFLRTPT